MWKTSPTYMVAARKVIATNAPFSRNLYCFRVPVSSNMIVIDRTKIAPTPRAPAITQRLSDRAKAAITPSNENEASRTSR
ncbi:hypothetical protein D3C80_1921670 [compost metagenome]